MATKMEEALKAQEHTKLTYEQLLVPIEQWKDGEWDLFMTIKDWLDVDYENRKQYLDSLMSHVRFSLLTPAQLEAVKKMKMYSDGSLQDNVQLGENYHKQPVLKKMMRPTSVRSKPRPVCFSEESPGSMHTMKEDGSWKAVDVPTQLQFEPHSEYVLLEFNNCLIIGGTEQLWPVFDASTSTWSQMRGMNTYCIKLQFALAQDGRYVYRLGGLEQDLLCEAEEKILDTIERFDPGTNTWTLMSTKLPTPLAEHSACVCSGPYFSIYVAGGFQKPYNDDGYSSAMSCFNPNEEKATWHSKAPMLVNSEVHVMREMAFDGKDPAIVIICKDLVMQYYDLKTDQWSMLNAWENTKIDWEWHPNGTVLPDPSENTLYILNICGNLPPGKKKREDPMEENEREQGVCAKLQLSKVDNTILGCPVKKFPIETECWVDYADRDYFSAMLAMPTPSKRMIPAPEVTAPAFKAKARAKRFNQRK